jgi:hypothetical protein
MPQIVFGVVAYSLVITFGGAWWAATAQSDLNSIRNENRTLKEDFRVLQAKGDRIAVLETQIGHIIKTLEKVETALNRNMPRPRT